MADYSNVDYLEHAISSIDLLQKLSKDQQVQLNPRQCEYLSEKLTETGCFLRAKSDTLICIRDSADIRRKALLQLHFAVKRAEKLVRGCCCETESWLEAAVTLSHIKEDIMDILLDLRWWTSMIDIAIASVTWMSSGQKIVLELLRCAEEDYGDLLKNLHLSDNGLQRAASKDVDLLLRKLRDVETSYAGIDRTAEQNHDYLLAVHVRSRLENSELETMEELNDYEDSMLIGQGGFGAVLNVKWMGRRCALKMLKQKCKKEATNLSEFQHPHIVKFFRYWEAPYTPTPHGTPHATPQGTPRSDNSMQSHLPMQSHILMEVLPMDLAQHLLTLKQANAVKFTVGSKRKPEHTRGLSIAEDVAIDVMLQVVKAMWHLNDKDVAHRDLKPNNVLVRLVTDDEVPELNYRGYLRAKLADFGLAKTKALSSALSTQPALGTRVYGAPEVFNKDIISDKKFPRRADVWSFGIMFCEILSGKSPFPGLEDGTMTLSELQNRIKAGLRPRLPENCPDYLRFIITSCCQLHPQDRPNFSDLLRMVRLAQVQSLGLIQKDHDLFTYKTRDGVKSLRALKEIPAHVLHVQSQAHPKWTLLQAFSSLKFRYALPFFSGPVRSAKSFHQQSASHGDFKSLPGSEMFTSSDCKPLGYLVNQVWPPSDSPNPSNANPSKVDVIFFEGNVGTRKDLSCKDTWVQRGKPNVWWPRDWLPKDLGGDIRVLLLEYSISDDGVEGVLDQLQRLLVFRDRWNRGHTWQRPIVLVGHSLGCVVIEHLVVALDKRARSIQTLDDEVEIGRAKVAQAFLASLAGCFFYAPPWTGLVPSEDLLKHVFGGLSYSRELFADLCLDSPKLKLLSDDFMRAQRKPMKLKAVIEGFHTRGRIVVPPASMQDFAGRVVELIDSNHRDVCKPTDKQHPAYMELLEFVGDILENFRAIQYPSNNNHQSLSDDKQPAGKLKSEFIIIDKFEPLVGCVGGPETHPFVAPRNLTFKVTLSKSGKEFHQKALKDSELDREEVFEEEIVVNQVWPLENSFACESTKLNIIFFEGNVGERKFMSVKETWVQRGNSGVCWPQDWLPVDLGGDIRVLLLKYCISNDSGLEGIVTDLQQKLIFSDRWNQNQEWENPIVLVGHSIGCVVIQNLVVRLHHMTQLIHNTASDSVKMQAKTSRAFIRSLTGCFFYAPPLKGFVPSESVLRLVFGGLSFSRNLFWDFAEASPKLRKLLEDFMLIITTRQIPIRVLLEGKKTGEEMVVKAPVELMEYVLKDSDHSEVCKPTSKDHQSYKEFFDFVSATLQIQGVSNTNSYQCRDLSKNSKNSPLSNDLSNVFNEDGSFIIVEELDNLSGDPKLSSNSLDNIHDDEEQKVVFRKQEDHIESLVGLSEENEELFNMVKQKINEIDNVAEMQQVDALDFMSGESQVLVICNHNDVNDTLVFHFLDGQSMAKVVGVGLDYAKIILQNGVDVEIQEIAKLEWESAWSDSKSSESTIYMIMKVTIPKQNDIKTTRVVNHKKDVDATVARPLLWDVAKYFTLQTILATLSQTDATDVGDGGQSSKNGQGNRNGNSNDTKSTKALFFYAFQSWFSMQFIKQGDRKDDEDEDENGDNEQRGQDKADDVNASHAKVKVSLLAAGYSFTDCNAQYLDVQISDRLMDLDIKWDLEFDFSRNEEGKKISLTEAKIYFGIGDDLEDDLADDFKYDHFGTFHDDLGVFFSIVTEEGLPASAVIDGDVKLHGCEQGKISYEEEVAKEHRKGKGHSGNISFRAGIPGGISIGVGGVATRVKSEGDIYTTKNCSEFSSIFTKCGFNIQEATRQKKGIMGFKFRAPCTTIEGANIWEKRDYRNNIRTYPPFQGQRIQFSGTWVPINDGNLNGSQLAKYQVKALRHLGEIVRTKTNAPSTSSKRLPKFLPSSKSKKAQMTFDFEKVLYKQLYEKMIYLNHAMTHWVDYKLMETEINGLTTASNSKCPLVALEVVT